MAGRYLTQSLVFSTTLAVGLMMQRHFANIVIGRVFARGDVGAAPWLGAEAVQSVRVA
jgi:hypothetical protein